MNYTGCLWPEKLLKQNKQERKAFSPGSNPGLAFTRKWIKYKRKEVLYYGKIAV